MFIELDESVVNSIQKINDCMDIEVQALDNLFQLMYQGKHIVYGTSDVLISIKNCNSLSNRTVRIIDDILNHYVEKYSNCYNRIETKLLICEDECDKVMNDDIKTMKLSDIVTLDKSILSTENPTDYDFYMSITNFIEKKFYNSQKNNVFVSLENRAFGGGSAEQYIKAMDKKGKILFAIADSDKSYEDDSQKSTANAITKSILNCKNAMGEFYILPVREKENLIPISFYNEICSPDKKAFLEAINTFSDNEEFMKYVDIKDGIKNKEIKKEISNSDVSSQWGNLYAPFIEECKRRQIYDDRNKKDNGDEKVIHGINGKLANQAVDIFLQKENSEKTSIQIIKSDILSYIPNYIMNIWKEIDNKLFNYGCALKPSHNSYIG